MQTGELLAVVYSITDVGIENRRSKFLRQTEPKEYNFLLKFKYE